MAQLMEQPVAAPTPEACLIHPTACVDDAEAIGPGTQVWHFCHVMAGARIGARCRLGQNVFVASGVVIGDNVKIQNNVSLYTGCSLEDDVFCGPSCVFTNVVNPRSEIFRRNEYRLTIVRRGATIGANATVVCGHTIGRYAFLGAGTVVNRDVPDYALVVGVPARQIGWMSRHGYRLPEPDAHGIRRCPASGWRYQEFEPGVLRCLDHPEDAPLPGVQAFGRSGGIHRDEQDEQDGTGPDKNRLPVHPGNPVHPVNADARPERLKP